MRKIDSLDEIKKINFEMLCYMQKVAEENHIKLMLSGGTLLGAVRHQGFIPWDDDIDVMLMRRDYDRLIRCIEKDKHPFYKVVTMQNCLSYHFPHAKVVDTRTYQHERKYLQYRGMGIAIDVFPIDYIPNSKRGQRLLFGFIDKTLYRAYDFLDTNYRDIGCGVEYWARIVAIRSASYIAELSSRFIGLKQSAYAAVVIAQYREKEIIRSKYVSHVTKVMFEGKEFLAPKGYKVYLSNLYGKKYMELPPENKRKPKHALDVGWR